MPNRRLVALLLFLQLLGLLLLTQPWFEISMEVDGKNSELGAFDGSQSYSITMSASLLLLAITLVVFLVAKISARILMAVSSLLSAFLGMWIVLLQVLSKSVSELDSQLERLTGIAKTHGISGLEIDVSMYPWFWLATCLIGSILSGYLATSTGGWSKPDLQKNTAKKAKTPTSAIDLWDAQRD